MFEFLPTFSLSLLSLATQTNTTMDAVDQTPNGVRDATDQNPNRVSVCVKIRPLSRDEIAAGSKSCLDVSLAKSGDLRVFQTDRCQYCSYFRLDKLFSFDHVYSEEDTQQMIFEDIGKPMVEACMNGYNTCIFAYGQTGSGKTYAMSGTPSSPGLCERIFTSVFQQIAQRKQQEPGSHAKILVSYTELYNESLRDLLGSAGSSKPLQIREHPVHGVHVNGLTEWKVATPQVLHASKKCD